MMKTFVLIWSLLPFVVFGQKAKPEITNPDILPEKEFKLTVRKIAPAEIKLPFSSIKIIDNRFDTSKIGFVPVLQIIANKKKTGRKVVLSEGIAKAIENYYNEFYQKAFSNTDTKLLIVMKKFWFSGVDDEKNKEIDISKNEESQRFLYCKWEYYLNKGEIFIPLKRIDTVVNGVTFESEINEDRKRNKEVLKLILNGLIEVPDFNRAVAGMEKLPQKTWVEIQKYNAAYYDVPVLRDTFFNKGVYVNFSEFKNNKPSIKNFTEKKIRLGLNKFENYLEDENGSRITKYWGYFDGNDLKTGKYGNEKLYRKNYTFEFFLKHQYTTGNEVWIPYQIDMETGEIY
ncbi:hypothetical protein [Ferruginibacter profundus]